MAWYAYRGAAIHLSYAASNSCWFEAQLGNISSRKVSTSALGGARRLCPSA